MVAYADGERIGPLPIDVEVVPGAVRVLAPNPGPNTVLEG
jgi:diacylglycerol kinase (ATP)